MTATARTPRRVQRTRPRKKGEPGVPPGARYVGRGTPYGNPFAVRWNGTRWQIIDTGDRSRSLREEPQTFARADKHYARVAATRLFELHTGPMGLYEYSPEDLAALRAELAGKDLACWCPLPEPGEPDYCHAAHQLRLANPPAPTSSGSEDGAREDGAQ